MLEIKNIKKSYTVGDIVTVALDDISIQFRDKEFVAILGTSGSGKTTALNIIGGLDRYDSGDLIIKGKHTRDFKDSDWDAYRNNSVGFVFQSYNLITHLSIVANVELGMTLSGVSKIEKKKKAIAVLERVGLKDHLHKKPNQLSGGQQQRVAIARALANDPEILLCDEPTGALDSTTSTQIMDLIKEIASDRLVIMVTHNPDLAKEYANRIIEFKDGKILSDSNHYEFDTYEDKFSLKKTSMNFLTALSLSFNNIRTKKGRTFLTSFASSIGIIGIAVILSLSTGFQTQIDKFQADALSEFPIMITKAQMDLNEDSIAQQMNPNQEFTDSDKLFLYDPLDDTMVHLNELDEEFVDYIEKIDPQFSSALGFTYSLNLNLIREIDGSYEPVSLKAKRGMNMPPMGGGGLSTYPIQLNPEEESMLDKSYDVLYGVIPKNERDIVLVVDGQNRIDENLLLALGFEIDNVETMNFSDIVGTKIKWIPNDSYYTKTPYGNYLPSSDHDLMSTSDGVVELNISAIVRQKKDVKLSLLQPGIVYSDILSRKILETELNSNIVKDQMDASYNVMTMEPVDESTKKQVLSYLGGNSDPVVITVYPKDFESKDEVLLYLDAFNENRAQENKVFYTDLASTLSSLTKGIMDGITVVLIAFAAISLVVSLIMISIITYTSVLERTKEIGVLKALGARKKDITRVFDAETFILGIFSGLLGVLIAYALTIPINIVILDMTGLANVATLQLDHALILVSISTILTMLGGHIPAKMASNKDAVEALRSE